MPTYLAELLLRVVLFQEVKAVIDESKSSASAAAESRLQAVDGAAFILYFKLFSELLNQLGLGDTAKLGVDHFDLTLLSVHQRINLHFAHVKNELSLSHLRFLINNNKPLTKRSDQQPDLIFRVTANLICRRKAQPPPTPNGYGKSVGLAENWGPRLKFNVKLLSLQSALLIIKSFVSSENGKSRAGLTCRRLQG